MKRLIILLLITAVFGLFSAGCDMAPVQDRPAIAGAGDAVGDLGAPMTKYKGGLPYAPKARYANLTSEYNDWKAHYVTSSGTGGYEYRVQRDAASDYDTVSEGMGYGMLLAVYFNDQITFDLLYAYVKNHFVQSNVPLMHWKVDKNNKNVSEFNDYAKETKSVTIGVPGKGSATGYTVKPKSVAEVPHDLVYFNKSTGKVFIFPAKADLDAKNKNLYKTLKANFDKNTKYYAGCEYARELSSATDADVDMAAALCFASRKWSTSNFWNYTLEADKMLKAIRKNDFSDNFLKNGNLWGDKACWNSSYFTPAYYSCVFYPFYKEHTELSAYKTERDFWRYLSNYIYPEMDKLRLSSVKGIWPDWCDTSNIDGRVRPSKGSDRHYIINGKNVKQMSYNFYYDAVRTPWRLATANSWLGNPNTTGEHYKQLATAMSFFKEVGIKNVVDGYSRWGGTWVEAYRDGFNPGQGGVSNSVTFVAMIATLSLPSFDKAWADECWDWVVYKKERYTDAHHYYGNTLRLLSLLYLSGQFVNIYQK